MICMWLETVLHESFGTIEGWVDKGIYHFPWDIQTPWTEQNEYFEKKLAILGLQTNLFNSKAMFLLSFVQNTANRVLHKAFQTVS